MLDIKRIKEDPAAVKAGLKAKEVDCDAVVDQILEMDGKIRSTTSSPFFAPAVRALYTSTFRRKAWTAHASSSKGTM